MAFGLLECLERDQRTVVTRIGTCGNVNLECVSRLKDTVTCLGCIRTRSSASEKAPAYVCRADSDTSDNIEVPINNCRVTEQSSWRRNRASRTHTFKHYLKKGRRLLNDDTELDDSVSAALYLLFIIGNLCSSGVAAPLSEHNAPKDTRKMARRFYVPQPFWINPCGIPDRSYNDQTPNFTPNDATKVQNAARNARLTTDEYKDFFVMEKNKMYNFAEPNSKWAEDASNLNHPWYTLPKKLLGETLPESYLQEAEKELLPHMYKYLELLTAAMDSMAKAPDQEFSAPVDPKLTAKLMQTVDKMRVLLCEFVEVLYLKRIEKLPSVEWWDIPERASDETTANFHDFLVFRDTLNFLEIVDQVFEYMSSGR